MINTIVWNHNLTSYVTKAFMEENGVQNVNGRYSIDPALCKIRENVFGYYDLMFKDRIVKRISFDEYLSLKHIVAEIYVEVLK